MTCWTLLFMMLLLNNNLTQRWIVRPPYLLLLTWLITFRHVLFYNSILLILHTNRHWVWLLRDELLLFQYMRRQLHISIVLNWLLILLLLLFLDFNLSLMLLLLSKLLISLNMSLRANIKIWSFYFAIC